MKTWITSLFFIFLQGEAAFGQTPKGLKPADQPTFSNGKTRALVIGISNYQYIDKLHYADRDAELFADYLANNSFWNIAREDITLLTNEKAKRGDVIAELQRMAILSRPGDNLLFYFSGHGDTETFTIFNKGYLLTYDTYSNNYMAGALSVNDLKDIFVTLTSNNIQVVVITDACRSGKLAGGKKGVEYTGIAMKTMWHNEIKILSSEPDQLSQEGPQWGNGRGVFSYYLIKGLHGDADENKDSLITLAELRSYFGHTVVEETNASQQPHVEGPKEYSTVIANIKKRSKTSPRATGGDHAPAFKFFRLPADSCLYYYRQLTTAIEEKKFELQDPFSATRLYRKFRACTKDSGLIFTANSQLLAALMNEAQGIVNNTFIGKNLVPEEKYGYAIGLFDQVLDNNDLRLPYQAQLTSLKEYLKVQDAASWGDEKLIAGVEPILDAAMKKDPDAAYLLSAKGLVELRKKNYTSSIQWLEKAIAKSPGWLIPKYYLGMAYGYKKNYTKALAYYEEVLYRDSSFQTFECTKCILERMAEYAMEIKQEAQALRYLYKSIDLFPDYEVTYQLLYDYALGTKNSGAAEKLIDILRRQPDSASAQLMRIRFEQEFYGSAINKAALDSVRYLVKNNYDSADWFYTVALQFDKKGKIVKNNSYVGVEDDSAYHYYLQAVDTDPEEPYYLYMLAVYLQQHQAHDALQEILESRIDRFSGEDKFSLQEELMISYYESYQAEKAIELAIGLKDNGYYTCDDLRKLKKYFGRYAEYKTYMKSCIDQ